MRYIIILLVSIAFLIASILSAFNIYVIVINKIFLPDDIISLASSALLLLSSAVFYPTICGLILSFCKIKDNLRAWLDKKKESK